MNITVISIFPEIIVNALGVGVTGRAINEHIINLITLNPRQFTTDKHHTVDDRPYGGGPGMVMRVEPLRQAISHAKQQQTAPSKVILLSPQGQLLTQQRVSQLSKERNLILVAGRYEGVDERLIETDIDEELSIGDYVLSGGELAAAVLVDAVARLIPGNS